MLLGGVTPGTAWVVAQEATPAPAMEAELLLVTTFPAEAFPPATYFPFVEEIVTVDPGQTPTMKPKISRCCPGPIIDIVLAGTGLLVVDGAVQVMATGESATPTAVSAGAGLTVGPGAIVVHRSEDGWAWTPVGGATLELLHVLLEPNRFPPPPPSWGYHDYRFVDPGLPVPLGALTVTVERVTLDPGAVVPPPETGAARAYVTDGPGLAITRQRDGTIANTGDQPITLYLLTVQASGAAASTPAP
ncbi:MAG TPA: hypothetical protein VFS74_04460 [Gemmatimonadales bacterium]|nr:hypothetical protein [Gemmatimonadales bacterium]